MVYAPVLEKVLLDLFYFLNKPNYHVPDGIANLSKILHLHMLWIWYLPILTFLGLDIRAFITTTHGDHIVEFYLGNIIQGF
jgi:hypothetical protein